MNSQEAMIAVWREKFVAEAQACAQAWVEAAIQRGRADALQAEIDALKKPPKLAAVENDAA